MWAEPRLLNLQTNLKPQSPKYAVKFVGSLSTLAGVPCASLMYPADASHNGRKFVYFIDFYFLTKQAACWEEDKTRPAGFQCAVQLKI
jgi:hypothetical protein